MSSVVIYLTAACPYCVRAKTLLDEKKVAYTELRVDLDNELRQEMQHRTSQFTVPQIFIGQTHIGGYDQMHALNMSNELDSLLFTNDAPKSHLTFGGK